MVGASAAGRSWEDDTPFRARIAAALVAASGVLCAAQVAGAISVAACVVYARTSDTGIDLDAPCTNTDSSGDRWFSLSKRTVGDTAVGGGGKGRMELLGGAGKYARVTGSCTCTTRYLADNLVVSQRNCTWRRP